MLVLAAAASLGTALPATAATASMSMASPGAAASVRMAPRAVTAAVSVVRPAAAVPCVSSAAATYRHTLDGARGTATITAVRPLCSGQSQSFALVSYTAGAPSTAAGQFIYSTDRASVDAAHRSVTLEVAVPACYTQVDAIIGTDLVTETTSGALPYGSTALGAPTGPGSRSAGRLAWYRGGSTTCAATPKVTFTNACDGSFGATLANDERAAVTAVFVTGGRLIRLAPGRSTSLPGPAGGTLTLRDSTFTTYVGSWRPPATGCTTAPATTPAVATAAPPASPSAVAASAPTATPPTSTAAAAADGPVFAPPAAAATTEPTVAVARSGAGAGSLLAIVFGLLLIGGGLFLLTRVIKAMRA